MPSTVCLRVWKLSLTRFEPVKVVVGKRRGFFVGPKILRSTPKRGGSKICVKFVECEYVFYQMLQNGSEVTPTGKVHLEWSGNQTVAKF